MKLFWDCTEDSNQIFGSKIIFSEIAASVWQILIVWPKLSGFMLIKHQVLSWINCANLDLTWLGVFSVHFVPYMSAAWPLYDLFATIVQYTEKYWLYGWDILKPPSSDVGIKYQHSFLQRLTDCTKQWDACKIIIISQARARARNKCGIFKIENDGMKK